MWPVSDYPLLVQARRRGWTYGKRPPAIPVLVAFVFTFGTVVLMTASLALLRARTALLGGVFCCAPLFPLMARRQYLDALFFMSPVRLLTLHDRLFHERNGVLVLAGAPLALEHGRRTTVSCLRWCWWSSGACSRSAGSMRLAPADGRCVGWTGAAAPRADVAVGSMPSEFVAKQSLSETVARLMDLSKYPVIASIFVKEAIRFGPWAPFDLIPLLVFWLLFVGFDIPSGVRHTLVAPAVMLFLTTVGYAFACLISPYDLRWQVDTALFRLQTQLWPSTLWAALLVAARGTQRLKELLADERPSSTSGGFAKALTRPSLRR